MALQEPFVSVTYTPVVVSSDRQTEKQTDRHTFCNTSHSYQGKVKHVHTYNVKWKQNNKMKRSTSMSKNSFCIVSLNSSNFCTK